MWPFKHGNECPTCKVYKEFLEVQRQSMKDTVQMLNTFTEEQRAARDRLEETILRFTRVIPSDNQTIVEKKPLPVQRKTWDRTRARLTNELEKSWQAKIEEESQRIRELDSKQSGDSINDRTA